MIIGDKIFVTPPPGASPVKPIAEMKIGEEEQKDSSPDGFAGVLKESWDKYEELSAESKALTAQLLTGQLDDMTGLMVSGEKASLQFDLNLRVRTKLLDSYSEILKTQV